MQLRPATASDLPGIIEIDAAIESHRYLHVDRIGDGLNVQWKIEDRPLRERVISKLALDDDLQFVYRQILTGLDEGLAQVAEYDEQIVAVMLAQKSGDLGGDVLKLIDLRVDFDFRRQGLATVLLYHAIQTGRDQKLRAVSAETLASNDPANQLLTKLGFQLTGLDTHRSSNHDLVKESVTLLWYLTLD